MKWDIDLSAAGTWAGVLVAIFGLFWVRQTIKNATQNSRNEKFVDLFMFFTEEMVGIKAHSAELRRAFEQGERSVNLGLMHEYYGRLWWFNLNEWHFFHAGFISPVLYEKWAASLHQHVHSKRPRYYFDHDGSTVALYNYDAYLQFAKEGFEYYPEFQRTIDAFRNLDMPAQKDRKYFAQICRILADNRPRNISQMK